MPGVAEHLRIDIRRCQRVVVGLATDEVPSAAVIAQDHGTARVDVRIAPDESLHAAVGQRSFQSPAERIRSDFSAESHVGAPSCGRRGDVGPAAADRLANELGRCLAVLPECGPGWSGATLTSRQMLPTIASRRPRNTESSSMIQNSVTRVSGGIEVRPPRAVVESAAAAAASRSDSSHDRSFRMP